MSNTNKAKQSSDSSQEGEEKTLNRESTKNSQDGSISQTIKEGDNVGTTTTDQQNNFYEQYKRLLAIGLHLREQMQALMQEKDKMMKKIDMLEVRAIFTQFHLDHPDEESEVNKKQEKRTRRQAAEINRKYKCAVKNCQKEYGL